MQGRLRCAAAAGATTCAAMWLAGGARAAHALRPPWRVRAPGLPTVSLPACARHRRPQIFPAVAADQRLYAMALEGYWMDVGQPKDYLTGVDRRASCMPAVLLHAGRIGAQRAGCARAAPPARGVQRAHPCALPRPCPCALQAWPCTWTACGGATLSSWRRGPTLRRALAVCTFGLGGRLSHGSMRGAPSSLCKSVACITHPCITHHPTSPLPQGNAIIDETVKIGQGCLIGPNVAIGKL